MTRPRPAPPRMNPGISKVPASCGADRSRQSAPNVTAAIPIGRLTKKTQRHESSVTRSPPSTGPMAGAKAVPMVIMLAARTRSDGGNTRNSIAMPTGTNMPPPAPWMTRKMTSSVMFCASPQRTDPNVKTTMADISTRFPPKRSPNQPEAGMNTARLTRYAMTIPSTAVGAMWKSRPIVGKATFTIVMSMMFMNMAETKTDADGDLLIDGDRGHELKTFLTVRGDRFWSPSARRTARNRVPDHMRQKTPPWAWGHGPGAGRCAAAGSEWLARSTSVEVGMSPGGAPTNPQGGWFPRALWPGLVSRRIGRSRLCGSASTNGRAVGHCLAVPAGPTDRPVCVESGLHHRDSRRVDQGPRCGGAEILQVRLLLCLPDGVHTAEGERQPEDPTRGDRGGHQPGLTFLTGLPGVGTHVPAAHRRFTGARSRR